MFNLRTDTTIQQWTFRFLTVSHQKTLAILNYTHLAPLLSAIHYKDVSFVQVLYRCVNLSILVTSKFKSPVTFGCQISFSIHQPIFFFQVELSSLSDMYLEPPLFSQIWEFKSFLIEVRAYFLSFLIVSQWMLPPCPQFLPYLVYRWFLCTIAKEYEISSMAKALHH